MEIRKGARRLNCAIRVFSISFSRRNLTDPPALRRVFRMTDLYARAGPFGCLFDDPDRPLGAPSRRVMFDVFVFYTYNWAPKLDAFESFLL